MTTATAANEFGAFQRSFTQYVRRQSVERSRARAAAPGRGGDRAAFKELYLIYHRRLARFLMRMTSRHDLIEEVINDTLWTVWLKAGDFRGDSLVSTWIVGITYRRALKALRRHGARATDAGRGSRSCAGRADWRTRIASGSGRRLRSCRSSSAW